MTYQIGPRSTANRGGAGPGARRRRCFTRGAPASRRPRRAPRSGSTSGSSRHGEPASKTSHIWPICSRPSSSSPFRSGTRRTTNRSERVSPSVSRASVPARSSMAMRMAPARAVGPKCLLRIDSFPADPDEIRRQVGELLRDDIAQDGGQGGEPPTRVTSTRSIGGAGGVRLLGRQSARWQIFADRRRRRLSTDGGRQEEKGDARGPPWADAHRSSSPRRWRPAAS